MQTEERLCGIVKTILRQLARQAGGARVMQIGSAIDGATRDSGAADEVQTPRIAVLGHAIAVVRLLGPVGGRSIATR